MSQAKLIKLQSTQKYQRLFSKDEGTHGIKAGHVILQSGENIGEHSTDEQEEVIIVLKGKGEARVDKDGILKIAPNVILYIPPNTAHDVKNTGKGILEYIYVTSSKK